MPNIAEIKERANICEVFVALGGEMRGRRGKAFWRGGDGVNVSLDESSGLWHDFAAGEGGDVFKLVETALGCDFRAALEWLVDFTGVPKTATRFPCDHDTDWSADLEWSEHWARAARDLAETVLEQLPSFSLYRAAPTELLRVLRLGEASRVAEYREWRRRDPAMTAALAHAGKRADANQQRRLARWLMRYCDGE
jgi:hypothetical protein